MLPVNPSSELANLPESSPTADGHETLNSVARVEDWAQFNTVLQQMNRAYKRAEFGANLCDAAVNVHSFLRDQERAESDQGRAEHSKFRKTSEYWKARTLIYELNDIFHFDLGINDAAVEQGEALYEELHTLSLRWDTLEQITDPDRTLVREKVMYASCRGTELRRRGKPEAAKKLFEWLREFTSSRLITKEFPCFGTQAILSYHLGSVYRVLEDHTLAEETYTQTLDLLYKREEARDDHRDRLFTIRRQAMTIGIGYGWVNATRGSLRRAENSLVTARSLLAGINDPIVPPFIELLLGTIKRCRAGTKRTKLLEAVELLIKAKDTLAKNKQARHIPRACWELSLAYDLLENFDESKKYLEQVATYADKVGHQKWQINVRILRSRSLRRQKQYERALEEAESAVEKAKDFNSTLPLTDAYITRGEAKFALVQDRNEFPQSYAEARKDFELALEKTGAPRVGEKDAGLPTNPKIVAVCELRIAQCFVRDGDEAKARSHFASWDILRGSVEHEWVRELAEKVKREIEGSLMNFTISARDPRAWDYARNVAQLRNWLLNQSLRHTKRNYSAAAELIGVKRGTLYQWQDDSRSQSQRARTKASVPQKLDP